MSSSPTWFSDEDLLLTELRRGRTVQDAPPVIPGYDEFTLLGRGGQGIVFSALQRSTHRRVAIKVLLDGAFASAAARRRFEREIELVAALEHPGVVRLFDSGTTLDGRLYTVMEFIEGVTLDAWMKAHRRAEAESSREWLAERVRMAIAIAGAVHHAHLRGVIHRDLKPGNVRVDAEGRPHVLDFGLAKSLSAEDAEGGRAVSMSGEFLGSVPWTSPEQAEGASSAIDARSDVYALGVIAYQLVTEAMPYDVSGPLTVTLRNVGSAVPVAPRSVNPEIGRDLETVLLKALSKEPERRYQSVGEFATDMQRCLQGEAVEARRDSTWYVLRKAARRHRAWLGAGAIACAAVVVGVALALWQWSVAEEQRARADRRFEEVRGLAHTVMFDLHDAIVELPGSRPARQVLATTAMEYLQRLAAESGGDASLLIEVADGHQRVGDILGNPYTANLGDTGAALAELERGLALVRPLAEQGNNAARRSAVALQTRIGDVLVMQGQRERAMEHYQSALDLISSLGAANGLSKVDRRMVMSTNLKIGDALTWNQDREAALARLTAAMRACEALASEPDSEDRDRFNLQICCSKVGFMLGELGRLDEALAMQRRALASSEALAAAAPDNAARQRSVLINLNQVGSMLVRLDR
ncbi:MAG: serine/threonine protein kinase, partial [Phycisphaerae bacterium]|nr:serine/threonine protein kinase [Phycisphaerae bacterium]